MTTQPPDPQGQNPQPPQGQYPQGQFPQGHYPQGQYPQGQHLQPGQPPYPQARFSQPAAGQTSPGADGGRNPLGLVSAILGAIPLLLTLISPFATLAAARGDNYGAIGAVNAVLNGIAFVLGAAALITGLIAIFRPGERKALAGIGTGLGIAATWGALSGFLYPVVMGLGGF